MPIVKHPIFVGWIALLVQFPFQCFFSFWAGGFLGGVSSAIFRLHTKAPFIAFGTLAFITIPFISYFGKKLNYSRTSYKFYDDHLEFEEGFFSQNRKAIRYRDVLEVTVRKGLLQRAAGLGTIYLGTLATGSGPRSNPFYAFGFGNVSASGVGVRDVHDPDAAYDQIRALVDAGRG